MIPTHSTLQASFLLCSLSLEFLLFNFLWPQSTIEGSPRDSVSHTPWSRLVGGTQLYQSQHKGVAYKKAVSDRSSKYFKPQSALKQKTPKHFRGIFNLVAGDPKLAANRER